MRSGLMFASTYIQSTVPMFVFTPTQRSPLNRNSSARQLNQTSPPSSRKRSTMAVESWCEVWAGI